MAEKGAEVGSAASAADLAPNRSARVVQIKTPRVAWSPGNLYSGIDMAYQFRYTDFGTTAHQQ
jgi:hypothetical protein